jgi:hypothetical protein
VIPEIEKMVHMGKTAQDLTAYAVPPVIAGSAHALIKSKATGANNGNVEEFLLGSGATLLGSGLVNRLL